MDPLASVEELRHLSGGAWVDEHAALTALRAASGQVRTYCGWAISYEDHAEAVVDSDGSRVITVPCLRLTEVHTVEVEGQAVTDYTWSAAGVLLRTGQRWPAALRAVRVVYSGGYVETPPELAAVVCGVAGRLSTPTGVASWSVGSQTVTYSGEAAPGLASVEEAILDRYRIFGS